MKLKLSPFLFLLCVLAYSPQADAKIKPELLLSSAKVQEIAAATSDWKQFSPEDNSFSILMPDTKISKETKKSSIYIMDLYTASTVRGVFLVGKIDFTQDLSEIKPEILFDSCFQGIIENDGKILNQKNISLDTYQGKEAEFKKSGLNGKVRVFVVGQRLYYLLFLTLQSDINTDIDKFFDSFQLNSTK